MLPMLLPQPMHWIRAVEIFQIDARTLILIQTSAADALFAARQLQDELLCDQELRSSIIRSCVPP